MSVITNAVLYVDGNWSPQLDHIIEHTIVLGADGRMQFFRGTGDYDATHLFDAGGTKSFVGKIYSAAFNFVAVKSLERWFDTIFTSDFAPYNCGAVLIIDHEKDGISTLIKAAKNA